ncbi:uncharacterized protein C2orf42-like isoform X2 [Polyodon spathula]|nr:uncharacterized protein C2orf42-like isoform X2 [Polyodon spathula]
MEGSPETAAVTPTTAPSTPSLSPRDRTKTPPFLSNLGKPTLRGIRKCPQCGVYNGTRGLSCKNQRCGAVFRDGAGRGSSNRRQQQQQQQPQPSAEAVRVVTGSDPSSSSSPRLYSVRQRDRGPDYRGFVELGVDEAEIRTPGGGALLTQVSSGRCYVPACCQTATPSAEPESPCLHVKLATECRLEASPLTLKSSVLGSLQASQEAKQAIWQLATESSGPLVQRITRSIMVVKCKASERHPLGYLHASFIERGKGRGGPQGPTGMRFQCSCQQAARGGAAGPRRGEEGGGAAGRRCVHFYACLCAFASDPKLQQEFSGFINGDPDGLTINPESLLLYRSAASPHCEPSIPAESKKVKGEGTTAVSVPPVTVRDGRSAGSTRRPAARKQVVSSALKRAGSNLPVDEAHVTLPFHQWLASVTERIHQTMHFQFDGKPEPLVFHIPQSFFEALQQRISAGNKKRLPNSTTAFVRRDALPLGSFSKYSWHVHNILQVKQIFDTPEVPLEVTQSFVKNGDGSFELFRCPSVRMEHVGDAVSGRSDRQPAIRPLELKTFLRVGNTAPDQKEPTPFIIEWIPDILPRSKVGELRLRFEYGHLHNGHVENTEQQAGPEQGLGLCPSDTNTH